MNLVGPVFVIMFDDRDVPPEVFGGEGAEVAAHARFEQVLTSYNANLFQRIDDGRRPLPSQEDPNLDYYKVTIAAGEDGCAHCGAGKMWAIVYVEHGQTEETEIGQTFGDKELADDICGWMNMAYEAGLEFAPELLERVDQLEEQLANITADYHRWRDAYLRLKYPGMDERVFGTEACKACDGSGVTVSRPSGGAES